MDENTSPQNTQGEYQLLTVKEAAKRLHLSRSAVYGLIRRGELPGVQPGPRRTLQAGGCR